MPTDPWLSASARSLHEHGGIRSRWPITVLDASRFPADAASLLVEGDPETGAPPDLLEPSHFCADFLASPAGHPFWLHLLDVIAAQEVTGTTASHSRVLAIARKSFRGDAPVMALPPRLCLDLSEFGRNGGRPVDEALLLALGQDAPLVRNASVKTGAPARPRPPTPYRVGERSAAIKDIRDDGPLVSCLMVSRGHWEIAQFGISSFRRQTYLHRELVIVTTNSRHDLARHIDALGDVSIRLHVVDEESLTLGAQRNHTLSLARGEFVSTWDDDDLSSPTRLSVMMSAIREGEADAAFLERQLVWWPRRRWICVSRTHAWENSMVARRSVVPPYPDISLGEDLPVTFAIKATRPCAVVDAPEVYLYIGHRSNTSAETHFFRLFAESGMSIAPQRYERALDVLTGWFDDLASMRTLLAASAPPAASSRRRRSSLPAVRVTPAAPLAPSVRSRHWVIALEMGSGMGHVRPCCSVARGLLAQGHRVTMVINADADPAPLAQFDGWPGCRIVAAPPNAAPAPSPSVCNTFADLLWEAGYGDEDWLSETLARWCALFVDLEPDEVLSDFAPTALLACHAMGLAGRALGTGFTIPPRCTPWPAFRPWQFRDGPSRAAQEQRLLQRCNAALAARGAPPLDSLADIHHRREPLLTPFPMLDPYAPWRPGIRYWSVDEPGTADTPPPPWRPGNALRVFVYLRGSSPMLAPLCELLLRVRCDALVYAPGAPPLTLATSDHVRVLPTPVAVGDVLPSVDLVVCHGGVGLTAACLRAGVPMLLMPMQAEQSITGFHLTGQGCAVTLYHPRDLTEDTWAHAVAALLEGPRTSQRVAETAAEIESRWPAAAAVALVDHLVQELERPS